MSNEKSATDAIEGYEITIGRFSPDGGTYTQVKKFCLHMNRVGGARITRPDDLIKQIEDAVFLNEEKHDGA